MCFVSESCVTDLYIVCMCLMVLSPGPFNKFFFDVVVKIMDVVADSAQTTPIHCASWGECFVEGVGNGQLGCHYIN